MLKVQGIIFHHIFWCSITHFVSFRLLAGVFWRVYRNCFLRALKIVLTEEKFSRTKKSFSKEFFQRVSDFEQKNYISGKQNQQECQTSVQLAQKNNLRKTMLKRKTFLYLFQTLIEKRWEVAQKNLVTFSKLKLTYPVE